MRPAEAVRSAEVGLFSPSATRERAKRLSTAYNLLYLEAGESMRGNIQPYKAAWESYFRTLMDSWQTAFFENGEVAAHEADFARLRQQVADSGTDVRLVPAIRPPSPLLSPVQSAAQEIGRGASILGAGLGIFGAYLLLRYIDKWRP